jgi:hypothetical protein
MNSSYFTEEHQSFREFKRFLVKKLFHTLRVGKTGTIERFIWKNLGDMGFFWNLIQKHTVV